MKKFILLLLALLISSNSILAIENYANLQIEVFSDGITQIKATTNVDYYKNLQTSKYTSKQGNYWIFNLTTNESFQDFIYEFTLPQGATINYLKTTQDFRITQENNQIKIVATGENKPIEIICQYSLQTLSNQSSLFDSIYTHILLFIIAMILGIIIHRIVTQTKDTSKHKENKVDAQDEEIKHVELSILPLRQQDIINILLKEEKITQKQLEEKMEIPKSSVSRNVKTLEIKGILIKEKSASTNYLSLNKKLHFK